MARDYELGLVLSPDVGDEQARAIVERVTQYVANNDGQVVRVNAWGRRHLAYPIQHHRDGLYFWFDLMLTPESVKGLERLLYVNEEVIRHLVKLRDPRVIAQQRQRDAEADVQAAAQAAAQAAQATQAAAAPAAAEPAAQAAPVEAAEPQAAEPAPVEAAEPQAAEEPEDEGDGEVVTTGAEAEA